MRLTAAGKRTANDIRKRLAAIEDELLADLDEATARTLLQAFEQIEARIASALRA